MVLKNFTAAVICAATLLAWCSRSDADEYRGGELLSLDLSRAVLSPKRLGPASEFEPFAIEARADPGIVTRKVRVARVRVEKPRAASTRLARQHGNPLDAQALDTRVQVWPCRSGGICNWQR